MTETGAGAGTGQADGPQFPANPYGELYKAWAAAAQSFLGRVGDDGAPNWAPAYRPKDVTRIWEALVGPWIGDGQTTLPLALPMPRTIDQQDVMALVAQAYFVWMSGGLRYSNRVAGLWNEYSRTLAERFATAASVPDAAGVELVTLVDEARAQLRQVGELTLQEARLLQEEMDRLAAEMRRLVDDQGPGEQRHRYWNVKP